MKIRGLVAVLLFCSMPEILRAQLLAEHFAYGASDTSDLTAVAPEWVRHSGTQGPAYVSTGLAFAGYALSGTGGCARFTNGASGVNDGDASRILSAPVTATSTIYVSLLVSLESAKGTGDYFFHLGPASIGATFRGRVFARSLGTGWALGLAKYNETRTDDSTVLTFGKTYLLVLKYAYSADSTNDDEVTLYAYDAGVPVSEPGLPLVMIGPVGKGIGGDPSNIGTVAIRQGTYTPTGTVDGIGVRTVWPDESLPVELTAFRVFANGRIVHIDWETATETNCYGFVVERARNAASAWEHVASVAGAGTSASPHAYRVQDEPGEPGRISYRLRQIDRDGTSAEIGITDVDIGAGERAARLSVYPNPFNPAAHVRFSVPEDGEVEVRLFSLVGREVALLFRGRVPGGSDQVVPLAAGSLSSGVYFCALSYGKERIMHRVLLVR